jgi:hypothetical protein
MPRPVQYINSKNELVIATFHQWGHECNEDGICGPVAIVELEDGYVATICAWRIKFMDRAIGAAPAKTGGE